MTLGTRTRAASSSPTTRVSCAGHRWAFEGTHHDITRYLGAEDPRPRDGSAPTRATALAFSAIPSSGAGSRSDGGRVPILAQERSWRKWHDHLNVEDLIPQRQISPSSGDANT